MSHDDQLTITTPTPQVHSYFPRFRTRCRTRLKPQLTLQLCLPLIILIFTTFLPVTSSTELEVITSGVRHAKRDDTALVFYANVTHKGPAGPAVIARLQMQKCCVKVNNETNCEVMKLISGLGMVFHSGSSHTLEMYFVNFDILDREGSCTINILSKPASQQQGQGQWQKGREFTVAFDTKRGSPSTLHRFFSAMGFSSKRSRICSEEENANARHECANQDCLVRYGGALSISHNETKQCRPTPACDGDTKHMVSYATGKCEPTRDDVKDGPFIRSSFTPEMKTIEEAWYHHLVVNPAENRQSSQDVRYKTISCEHGKLIIGTRNCTCDNGWRSLTREEWIEKGGLIEPDGSVAIDTLCNIPSIEMSKRRMLIFGFLIVCVLVPFFALLMWVIQKRSSEDMKSSSRDKESSSSGNSSMEEEEMESIPSESEILEPNLDEICGRRQAQPKEEEEDLDKIISEITNRRESKPKSVSYFNPPPPPPPPSAGGSAYSQPPLSSSHVDTSGTASSHKPPPSSSGSRHQPPPPGPSKSSTQVGQGRQAKVRFSPSSSSQGFIPGSDPDPEDVYNENNIVRSSPSTDELLSMRRNEMRGAHIPMEPVSASSSRVTISTSAEGLDSMNNNLRLVSSSLSSISSEEVTQQKKQQWNQFIKSVSEEQLPLPAATRKAHLAIQLEDLEDEEDEGDVDKRMGSESASAMKVRSLPEVQGSLLCMQTPPQQIVQESVKAMPKEEFRSRQEAYSLLQSLSNPRLEERNGVHVEGQGQKREKFVPLIHSNEDLLRSPQKPFVPLIHSNDDLRSPQKTYVPLIHSNEDLQAPKKTFVPLIHSNEDLRTQTIYGDLGSDADSDGALEHLKSPLPQDPAPRARPTVAETFKANQRNLRLFQFPTQTSTEELQTLKATPKEAIPSDSFTTTSAVSPQSSVTEVTAVKAQRSNSSVELGIGIGGSRSHVHCHGAQVPGSDKVYDWLRLGQQVDSNANVNHPPPPSAPSLEAEAGSNNGKMETCQLEFERESAYGIKARLEEALKATKSRSCEAGLFRL